MASLGLVEMLFLLAPLAVVPMGVALVDPRRTPRDIRRALPLAALLAAASFGPRAGPMAGVLAAAWLLMTARLALWGMMRLARRSGADASESAIDLGLLALPVGGTWLMASRLGLQPMGFEEPIVLLTAVHFHFAAFAALVWTGLASRQLPASSARRAAVAGVAVGTPLLAAGITFTPWLELVGALLLAASLGWTAVQVLRLVVPRARAGRALLAVSAVSILCGLGLAVAYAWGQAVTPVVSLAQMARWHGTLNALGFAVCGLLGWTRFTGGAAAS